MAADIEVVIYYGPASWFHDQIGDRKTKNLVALTHEMDERQRQLRVTGLREADDQPVPKPRRPKLVVAEASDFASLNEHVITNFAGFVRNLRPKQLFVNNPPARVHEQLKRAMASTRVEHYTYPTVTAETLVEFRDGFADHLVGQNAVKELILAAMYPLTRIDRKTPVVLMLYGPSGVGKTETAQFINGLLGGDLLRKQFSMFHSDKFTSYLFGGSHSEASLARDLLDRESGVILIDEFDKANPVFHSAFYQLFDSGEFVDKNYTVELGPSLIICTSNYGSEAEIRQALGDALSSRFDALIEYEQLSVGDVVKVIERIVDDRLTHMTADERPHINRAELLNRLLPLAANSGNVRQLGKTIDTTISLALVRSALEQPTTPAIVEKLHLVARPEASGE